MVSVLVSGLSSPGQNPGQGYCVALLGKRGHSFAGLVSIKSCQAQMLEAWGKSAWNLRNDCKTPNYWCVCETVRIICLNLL